jgi:PAS domain S-box-containing protein
MPTDRGSSATTVFGRRKNDQGLARTLLDTVDALIVALDTTGRIVTFNGACERATGWASEEVVGRYLWDLLIPEEERESVRAVFSHLTATSLPSRFTNSWLTRSGGRVVIEWSNAVVPGPSGAVGLVLGTGIDVTARREAERDLEALFETMVDGIALHQVVVDRAARPVDFRYLRVNPAFERIMGLTVASLVGRTTSEVLADARWNEALGQAALRGQPAHFEVEQTRAHRRLEVTAYGSGPGHVAAIVVDVSTRRRAEEALRAIVAGTAGVTGADFFAHLAEHLARALGVRTALVAEIEGGVASRARTLAVWDRGAPRPAFAYELAGTPGEVAASQGTCFVPDGVQSRFPGDRRLQDLDAVSYMASLLRDPQGKVVGLMAIADDKPMQDAEPAQSLLSIFSARAAAELSRLQAEAAKDRVEAQLRQAQRMEAVGQLAGGVAHDFNNMLQAIVGHTDIALDRVGEQHPAAADLLDARRAVERATTLTRQLLTFSRREALRPEVLSLNDLVEDMTKMLRRVLGEAVELDVRAEPMLQPVLGDRGQLEQVLLNLCINARDAMPDGGTLTIVTSSAGPRDDDGDTAARVCLSVSDTGTGIPVEIRERIFEPFFTTKETGKGTGLGLATVYAIVERHGGSVELSSEVGRGTTFRVLIPATLGTRPPRATARAEGTAPGGTETIFVAEDNDMVRSLAAALLRGSGYRVLLARDGEEAERVFREHADEIDLALVDVVMPKRSGWALRSQIRSEKPGIPVLFVSGYAEGLPDLDEVRGDGCDLLLKPFHPAELLRLVRRLLDARRGR